MENEVAGPIDADTPAKRLGEKLPYNDSDVLDCVVLVDFQIAFCPKAQVEGAMLGKQL